MTTTASGKSSGSSSVLRTLSSSQRLHNHHHHHHHPQRSASSSNLNLRLKFSPGTQKNPKPSSSAVHKRKCLCSPTTHPGSFRCAFHRRLAHEKSKTLISPPPQARINFGLNLRKLALMNSLAKIGSLAAKRFRKSLAATLIKPSSSSLHISRRVEFRPRPSRFYTLHKDQN